MRDVQTMMEYKGYVAAVELDDSGPLLVAKGADIDARDFRGRTAYRMAEGSKQSFQFQSWPETAALLAALGADTRLGIPAPGRNVCETSPSPSPPASPDPVHLHSCSDDPGPCRRRQGGASAAARRTRPGNRGILGLHCFSENCRRRSAEAESHSPHQS